MRVPGKFVVERDKSIGNSQLFKRQLCITTDNSHHRYDVLLLINGVPVTQIELKTLGFNPRRAMVQIVD